MKTDNTPTTIISAYNLETLAQTNGTHEITVNTSKEFYALHDYLVFDLGWGNYHHAHVSQDGNVTINIRVNKNQPEPTNHNNTPTTMNANEINAPEFSELSHAGQCLDIYLHNTREIYERYTVPAIKKVAAMMRSNATHPQQFDVSPAGVSGLWEVIRAISAAAGLVRKYDQLAPTQDDKKQVIRNYAAYIVDCAKYEIGTA